MTTLATFDILLRGDTRQYEQSMGQATKTSRNFISQMGAVAGGMIIANASMMVFGKGLNFVKDSLIGYNARMEQAEIGFKTLLRDEKMAISFIEQLKKFAATTPFDFPGLQTAANTMIGMGFAAQDVIPTLTAVGDMMAALGKTGSEMINRVIYNLGQMKQLGYVSGRDIRDLAMLGVPVYKILGKAFGKSEAAIKDMVSKGVIPADKAIDALVKGIESSNMGGMMVEQAKTFTGSMSTIKDTLSNLGGTALKPAFEAIRNIVYAFSLLVQDQRAVDFVNKVATVVRALVIILQNAVPAILTFGRSLITGVVTWIRSVQTFITSVMALTNQLIKNLSTGGWNAIVAYAQGMWDAYRTYVVTIVNAIVNYVSDYLIGNSPPKKGPLSKINSGGKAVIDSWVQGALSADLTPITSIPAKIAGSLKAMEASAKYVQANITRLNDKIGLLDLNTAKLQLTASRLRTAYDTAIAPLQKQYDLLMATYTVADKKRDLDLALKKNALQQQLVAAKGDWWLQAQIQSQIDLVDKAEEQNRLLEEQESLKAQVAAIPLEEQMKALTDELNKALDPINAQLAIYQAQRDELNYQAQVWQLIATQVERTASAMKEAAASSTAASGGGAGKKGVKGAVDTGAPKDVIHRVPIDEKIFTDKAAIEKAGQEMAQAWITGFTGYAATRWPTLLGAAIGGILGFLIPIPGLGLVLGASIGALIGTIFSDNIVKAADDGMKMLQDVLTNGIDPGQVDIGETIRNGINGAVTWVLEEGVPGLANALKGLAEGFLEWIPGALVELALNLPRIGLAIWQFIIDMGPTILAHLGEWIQSFSIWANKEAPAALARGLPKAAQAIWDFLAETADKLPGMFTDLGTNLIEAFDLDKVWEAVEGTFNDIIDGVGDWFASIVSGFTDGGEDAVASTEDFIGDVLDWFGSLPAAITGFIDESWTSITTFFSELPGKAFQLGLDIMAQLASALLTGAAILVSIAVTLGQNAIGWLVALPGQALTLGQEFVANVTTFFSELPGKIGTFIGEVKKNISTWIADLGKKATKGGSDFVSNITSFFTGLPGKIGGFLSDTWTKVTTFVGDLAKKGTTAGSDFVKNIGTELGKIPGNVGKMFGDVVKWLTTNVPKIAGEFGAGAKKMGKAFANGILGLMQGALNTIVRAINKIQVHFDGFTIDMGPAGKVRIAGFDWNGMQLPLINLPRFRKGAWDTGPRSFPAMLDPHEMVIPKEFASGLRGDNGKAGVTVNGPLVQIENFNGSDRDVHELMTKMSTALRLQTARR